MKTLSADAIARILDQRRPTEVGNTQGIGMWLSLVVAFSLALYPNQKTERIAFAAACGWAVQPPARLGEPALVGETLLQLELHEHPPPLPW